MFRWTPENGYNVIKSKRQLSLLGCGRWKCYWSGKLAFRFSRQEPFLRRNYGTKYSFIVNCVLLDLIKHSPNRWRCMSYKPFLSESGQSLHCWSDKRWSCDNFHLPSCLSNFRTCMFVTLLWFFIWRGGMKTKLPLCCFSGYSWCWEFAQQVSRTGCHT